jgi:hypothetical protein
MPKKWHNQYGYGPNPKEEWERHAEMFKDSPSFEDDPTAASADTIGSYNQNSVGETGILKGDDMGDYGGNGEKPQ